MTRETINGIQKSQKFKNIYVGYTDYGQWLNCKKEMGGMLHLLFPSFTPLPIPSSFPLP